VAGDFVGEGFFVAEPKTPTGKRWVPLLGVALAIVKRRAKGRASADPLRPEFTAGGPDGKRSHAASKRWNRWRKEFLPDTQIDFHSLRRFWVTMVEQAGLDAVMIARLVGHSSPVWCLATYSAGQQKKQLKNGMDKVRKRIVAAIDPRERRQSLALEGSAGSTSPK
jgi:integrase